MSEGVQMDAGSRWRLPEVRAFLTPDRLRVIFAFGSPTTRIAFEPVRVCTSAASAASVVSGITKRCDPGGSSYFGSRPSARAEPTNVKSGRCACM